MTEILGYDRVSWGEQDVVGQTMRLTEAGAIRVFTDVLSVKSMNRPSLSGIFGLRCSHHGASVAIGDPSPMAKRGGKITSRANDQRPDLQI